LLESELGFDLLIHDLLNPHLDGISLLQQAKQRFQALPVIVATAIDDEAAELACLQNGAFAYLRKPLQIEQLLETVSRALSVKSVSKVAED
jgi:two-component system response regulator AtoC